MIRRICDKALRCSLALSGYLTKLIIGKVFQTLLFLLFFKLLLTKNSVKLNIGEPSFGHQLKVKLKKVKKLHTKTKTVSFKLQFSESLTLGNCESLFMEKCESINFKFNFSRL